MTDPKQKRTFEAQAVPALSLAPQPKKSEENSDQPRLKPGLVEISDQEQNEILDKLINRLKKI